MMVIASSIMAASATEEQIALRLLIDDKKNRVVFAQAEKDFVDLLMSFLTLPLGTIARLVDKESNMKKVSIGSLSSLYESVAKLDEKRIWTETCKEMLLHPRNSMESYCQNLKLNIDDTEKTMYFICENIECSRQSSGGLLSTFRDRRCKCGKLMNRLINHLSSSSVGRIHDEGFVPEMVNFIISDDLMVNPENFKTFACLPMSLGYEDFNVVREVTVTVTKKEILDLLKCSLFSKTPLTDTFLKKDQIIEDSLLRSVLDSDIGELETNDGGQMIMEVKVIIRKSNRKVLLALAEADFVDFLFSILTFPLGGVEHMLNGKSGMSSIDNLYKSVVDLDGCIYLRSPNLKDNLIKSRLAHQFKLHNQILPIDEVPTSSYSCYSKIDKSAYLVVVQGYRKVVYPSSFRTDEVYAPLSYLEPQSSKGETYSNYGGRGFAKRPSLYMVTDDLVVTPTSTLSVVSFLTESRIPPSDLEERVINIGKKEGLSLLKASLLSSSALTNGLSQFIKPIEVENFLNVNQWKIL